MEETTSVLQRVKRCVDALVSRLCLVLLPTQEMCGSVRPISPILLIQDFMQYATVGRMLLKELPELWLLYP